MNIATILNILKEKKLVPNNEDGISLFSDCFNKFGISILLLKDEEKFNKIVDLLVENKISLQKANGMYCLRLFAVDYNELNAIIGEYKALQELDFLRKYPEIIAEAKTVHTIAQNMKQFQEANVSYKNGETYDIDALINEKSQTHALLSVSDVLKSYLKNPVLLDNLTNGVYSDEENMDSALNLQKVENKICEEYLVSNGNTWDIIINDKVVNTYEHIKDTIQKINTLNLVVDYDDAFLLVLFYGTKLSASEVKEIIDNEMNKEVSA